MTPEQSSDRNCSACGSLVPAGLAFCVQCGVQLGPSAAPLPSTPLIPASLS